MNSIIPAFRRTSIVIAIGSALSFVPACEREYSYTSVPIPEFSVIVGYEGRAFAMELRLGSWCQRCWEFDGWRLRSRWKMRAESFSVSPTWQLRLCQSEKGLRATKVADLQNAPPERILLFEALTLTAEHQPRISGPLRDAALELEAQAPDVLHGGSTALLVSLNPLVVGILDPVSVLHEPRKTEFGLVLEAALMEKCVQDLDVLLLDLHFLTLESLDCVLDRVLYIDADNQAKVSRCPTTPRRLLCMPIKEVCPD